MEKIGNRLAVLAERIPWEACLGELDRVARPRTRDLAGDRMRVKLSEILPGRRFVGGGSGARSAELRDHEGFYRELRSRLLTCDP